MTASFMEIERRARELKPGERAKLVEILLESLEPPRTGIEAARDREIEERIAACYRGDMPGYAAEEVFADADRLTR